MTSFVDFLQHVDMDISVPHRNLKDDLLQRNIKNIFCQVNISKQQHSSSFTRVLPSKYASTATTSFSVGSTSLGIFNPAIAMQHFPITNYSRLY
jgi:hypothetical protein